MTQQVVVLTFELRRPVCGACIADMMLEAVSTYMDELADQPLKAAILAIQCAIPPDSPVDPDHAARLGGSPGVVQ